MKKYKVSFEVVALADAKIFANAVSVEQIEQAMQEYRDLLDACGWEQKEYEDILLAKIDNGWN